MTARVDTIVEGGRVVTASEAYDAAIAITGGRIVAIGPAALLPLASRRIDATGKYVLPGAIDSHVHFGWDYNGWRQGSVAAAHAGLTTFVAFALYDDQAGQTLPQALATLVPEVSAQSVLDFGFHFILDPEPEWTIRAADQKGIAGYTLYEGRRVKGRPWMTLVRGREVLRPDGTLGAPPGYGRFVPRTGPLPPLAGPVR